jgi:hypothetical protein
MLGNPAFTVAAEEVTVDLVRVTVQELGFKNDANYDQICKRAEELGLELCPPEVGPQLRLRYKNQPNGEWILVAMEPIVDSNGHPRVFLVECIDSKLWLNSDGRSPDSFWNATCQWIFCRPK